MLAPLTSVWANTADGRPNARARDVGEAFESLVDGLFARRIDAHIVDTAFVLGSELDGASLREGRVTVNALIIPPMPVMERAVAVRLAEFVKAGGRLVWGGELPTASAEAGADDEDLLRLVKPLTPAGASTKRGSRMGKGRIFTLKEDAADWLDRLAARLTTATSLASDTDGVALAARRLEGGEVVLVVNETPEEQKVAVKSRARGAAELWDPETGTRQSISTTGARTRRTAEFAIPGHTARAVVFDAATKPARGSTSRRAPRVKPMELSTEWQFALETGVPTGQGTVRRTELPVMRFQDFALGAGRLERLRDPAYDDSTWRELWLTSADANAVGNWRASWITGVRQPDGWVVRPDSEGPRPAALHQVAHDHRPADQGLGHVRGRRARHRLHERHGARRVRRLVQSGDLQHHALPAAGPEHDRGGCRKQLRHAAFVAIRGPDRPCDPASRWWWSPTRPGTCRRRARRCGPARHSPATCPP